MLDRRIISWLPTAERDPHCDKTYDCTINDRFFTTKTHCPSCPEAEKTHASPSLLVSAGQGHGTAWGEVSPHLPLHPPDKVGRGGEVLEPGHTDRPLGLYLGASLAQRQRKARTEDPCIRSAELDLSVAGSVAGRR